MQVQAVSAKPSIAHTSYTDINHCGGVFVFDKQIPQDRQMLVMHCNRDQNLGCELGTCEAPL
jgi:hypothetical protein